MKIIMTIDEDGSISMEKSTNDWDNRPTDSTSVELKDYSYKDRLSNGGDYDGNDIKIKTDDNNEKYAEVTYYFH